MAGLEGLKPITEQERNARKRDRLVMTKGQLDVVHEALSKALQFASFANDLNEPDIQRAIRFLFSARHNVDMALNRITDELREP